MRHASVRGCDASSERSPVRVEAIEHPNRIERRDATGQKYRTRSGASLAAGDAESPRAGTSNPWPLPMLCDRTPRRPLALALVLGVALGAACRPQPVERVLVGSIRIPSMALLYIAEDQGCLRGDGPEIVLRDYATGRDAVAALRRGEVAVAAAYQTPVVLNTLEDASLRILTTLHTAARNTHVVARADRGIRTAADLRGKRIGVPSRTNAEYFVRALLAFEGIDPGEVTVVDVSPPDAAAGELGSGRVDAVAVWSPHVDAAAAALPPDLRVELFSDVYTEASMLVTTEEVRAARPAALAKLVRCAVEAQRLVDAAPDRGRALVARAFREQDPSVLDRQWNDLTHQIGLQNALVSILTQEAEWIRETERTAGPLPRFPAMFAPEFLAASAPESVTYVRR